MTAIVVEKIHSDGADELQTKYTFASNKRSDRKDLRINPDLRLDETATHIRHILKYFQSYTGNGDSGKAKIKEAVLLLIVKFNWIRLQKYVKNLESDLGRLKLSMMPEYADLAGYLSDSVDLGDANLQFLSCKKPDDSKCKFLPI